MNQPKYRVFLWSDDAGRLTHESDVDSFEAATDVVQGWLGDRDFDEEAARGMFRIEQLLNWHLRGAWHVNIIARDKDWGKDLTGQITALGGGTLSVEEITAKAHAMHVEMAKKQKVILHAKFPVYETAMLEVDRAIDNYLSELDPRLYGRIQRQQRADGIHERFLTDAKPFGLEIYAGEYAVRYKHAADTTVEELQAIQFWPEGMGKKSAEQVFPVECGALRVTDPCYKLDTWCAGNSENVLNGNWHGHIQYFREGFESYQKDRWDEMLTKFADPENSEALSHLQTIADDLELDPERRARILAHIHERSLEDFNHYGNPDDWIGRVAYLHIRHDSVLDQPIDPSQFVRSPIEVGVDSGQAGFFDLAKYTAALADKNDHKREDQPIFEAFYDTCGNKTLSRESWGATEFGVVSSSGYGDGGYTLFERRNEAGELVEARIVYMREGSEEFVGAEEDEGEEE